MVRRLSGAWGTGERWPVPPAGRGRAEGAAANRILASMQRTPDDTSRQDPRDGPSHGPTDDPSGGRGAAAASPLRIATRRSPLALWQAEHVRDRMLAADPAVAVELLPMTTTGDQRLDRPLSTLGGKSLFVKELERALIDGEADLAVHSMKDVSADLPDGLDIATVLEREDPLDAFVSNDHASLASLPEGARVGTASLRRRAQLLAVRPDLVVGLLRGNVNSRLAKLDAGEHDAIILACAGLERLGFGGRIAERLDPTVSLPAIGQGVIGIELRADDAALAARLAALHHPATALRLAAERALSRRLNGGCSAPIAGHARLEGGELRMVARVIAIDGTRTLEASDALALAGTDDATLGRRATLDAAAALGTALAERLLADGADALLADAAEAVLAEAAALDAALDAVAAGGADTIVAAAAPADGAGRGA